MTILAICLGAVVGAALYLTARLKAEGDRDWAAHQRHQRFTRVAATFASMGTAMSRLGYHAREADGALSRLRDALAALPPTAFTDEARRADAEWEARDD